MKNKIIFAFALFLLPAFFLVGNVSAAENDTRITYQKMNGAYKTQTNKTTGEVYSHHVNKYLLNGKIAYCVEPMVEINTRYYNSTTDWSVTNLSDESIRYIERVGYFGYEYEGHNTDRFWMATQYLIWQKANPNIDVKFTTGENGTGEVIDLTNEINEILSLVNQYDKTPNFNVDTIEGTIGTEVTVTDTNNVLSGYDLNYSGKHTVSKDGNTLKVQFTENEINDEVITFFRPKGNDKVTLIYYQGSSQKLASVTISSPTTSTVKIRSIGGKTEVNKTGEKVNYENGSYNYENIKLPNATFGLYANEDIKDSEGNIVYQKYHLVGTLTSNELGVAIIDNLLYGKYFLIETESSLDNMLSNERYYFELTKDDLKDGKLIKTIDFQNYLPKGTLEFTKTDLTDGKVIPNTTIQIFTEEDRLIYTGTTDENGKITITDIPVGKYYIIEKNPATGYQITDEKVYFEITENGEVVKANMTDKKIEVPNIEMPKTFNTDLISLIIIGGSALIGTGLVIYGNKKKKE